MFNQNELYHYGIRNQKWGVRKYQNPDGSLTEEGKRRYGYKKNVLSEAKNITDTLAEITSNFGKGSIRKNGNYRNISTTELRKRVNRLSLERQYSDLMGDTKYVMSGRDKVREILQTVGAGLGIGASTVGIALAIKQLVN